MYRLEIKTDNNVHIRYFSSLSKARKYKRSAEGNGHKVSLKPLDQGGKR